MNNKNLVINLEDLKHGARVANISQQIGMEIGIKKDELKKLEVAAIFHDIGKIYLNQEILNKKGKLDREERIHIQSHAKYSYEEVLKMEIDNREEVAKIIKYHHENYDGSGYPEGLKGEEIPLNSRIIRLSDMYDALTSERVYRKRLNINKALEIIESEKESFDPMVYDIFFKIVRDINLKDYINLENKYMLGGIIR